MKVKEARQLVEEVLDALKQVKDKDLIIVKQDLYKTKPTARLCNGVSFTFRYFTNEKNNFFKVAVNLWHNIDGSLREDYQKYLMQKIWNKVKEVDVKPDSKTILSNYAKIVCNGLGTYNTPKAKPRKEPVYIDHDSAYIDTGVIPSTSNYARLDVDLTGYAVQQVLKQHRDDLLISGPKDHPRVNDEEIGKYTY